MVIMKIAIRFHLGLGLRATERRRPPFRDLSFVQQGSRLCIQLN